MSYVGTNFGQYLCGDAYTDPLEVARQVPKNGLAKRYCDTAALVLVNAAGFT
jgi:hypothetical protein